METFTILAVEDNPAVRGLVKSLLAQQGLNVLEAQDAESALEVFHSHANEVQLVFTDILMPGTMNGLELGQRLTQEKAELKVIYTSGSSIEYFEGGTELEEGVNYLAKPYRGNKLRHIIAQALQKTA